MVEVSASSLRVASNRLFDHLEAQGVQTLSIERDFYWDIPDEELFDMSKKPSQLVVGSLADDWEFAQNLLTRTGSPPVAYQLTQLAPLFRCFGIRLATELAPRGG